MSIRTEKDSMGELKVPGDCLYGATTQRAVENFPVSGIRFPREFIQALGYIKFASTKANRDLGLLDPKLADAIQTSSLEVAKGTHDDHFPLDIFQTGSGTSTNMNANEVIANLANMALGGKIGAKSPVHPNDHVNLGQSSNDVIPTAIHVSTLVVIDRALIPALTQLEHALSNRAAAFKNIVKTGRTHLQDATPVTLGQEFSGYARQIALGIKRVKNCYDSLLELAIGGTAVGTGINTHPQFAKKVCAELTALLKLPFREAENHFESQGAKDACVETSSSLKTVAVSLMKIANDIRLMASGPRCGLQEIALPATQPGSSIMPGKVNPVIAESVCQVAAQVMGNDLAITVGAQAGNLELNVMMPLIAHNLLQSIKLLTNVSCLFATKCISQIEANIEECQKSIDWGLSLVTALAPHIGYDQAAGLAKEAFKTGKTIREVALARKVLPKEKLDDLLNPTHMLQPTPLK